MKIFRKFRVPTPTLAQYLLAYIELWISPCIAWNNKQIYIKLVFAAIVITDILTSTIEKDSTFLTATCPWSRLKYAVLLIHVSPKLFINSHRMDITYHKYYMVYKQTNHKNFFNCHFLNFTWQRCHFRQLKLVGKLTSHFELIKHAWNINFSVYYSWLITKYIFQ